jgi:hypothetical protein
VDELTIATVDDRTKFRPGDTVEVLAQWQLEEPPQAIELRLLWYTVGKGSTDTSVVEAVRFEAPRMIDARRWSVQIPNGPYSFSGKLISLIWALEMAVEPSGASERLELTVGPRGEEILLHRDGLEG